MQTEQPGVEPDSLIDIATAQRTAARLLSPGPRVTDAEARAVVAELYDCAHTSVSLVADITGIPPATAATVTVVDRPSWANHNAEALGKMFAPLWQKVSQRTDVSRLAKDLGRRVVAAEVGAVLAYVGSRVLGQFDPFASDDGVLMLVAPNIISVERKIDANPSEFRMWVAVHEQTHQQQFAAAPWLKQYLLDGMVELMDHPALTGPAAGASNTGPFGSLRDSISRLPQSLSAGSGGLADLFHTPEQQQTALRMTACMSVLEGHADVVMDNVPPTVIADIKTLRTAFSKHRGVKNPIDTIVRRLIGLEAKLAQYTTGAVFVRGVLDEAGWTGFNTIWDSPTNLPTTDELTNPTQWVARVLA